MHGTIPTNTIRLVFSKTNRFFAEYDPIRGLLTSVDRGITEVFDLVRIEREHAKTKDADQAQGGAACGDGNRPSS